MALQIDELAAADRGVLRQASVMGTRFTRAGLVAALELDDAARGGDPRSASRASSWPTARAASRSATGCCATPPTTGCRSAAGACSTAGSASRSSSARTPTSRTSPADLTHHFFEAGVWEKSLRYGLVAGAAARGRVRERRRGAPCSSARSPRARRWRGARPEAVMLRGRGARRRDGSRSASSSARARPSPSRAGACAATRSSARGCCARRRSSPTGSARTRGRCACSTAALALLEGASSVPATAQRARIEALARDHHALARPPARVGRPGCGARSPTARRSTPRRRSRTRSQVSTWPTTRSETRGARPTARGRSSSTGSSATSSARAACSTTSGMIAYFAGRWNEALELYREGARGLGSGRRHAQRVDGELQHRRDPLGSGQARRGRAAAARGRAIEPGGRRRVTDIAESMMETALLDARRGQRRAARSRSSRRRDGLLEQTGNESATLLIDARVAEALELGGEYDRAAELAARTLARAAGDEGSALVLPVLHRVLGQAHLSPGGATRRARRSSSRSPRRTASSTATRRRSRSPRSRRLGDASARGAGAPRRPLRAARHRRAARRLGAEEDGSAGGRPARASLPQHRLRLAPELRVVAGQCRRW